MTHVADGRTAEQAAAEYLSRRGFEIVVRNWRTPRCEIDIVGRLGGVLYFCEVKYRRTANQGSGLDYITPVKLRRMAFAAEVWVQRHGWEGEYRLGAVEVAGVGYVVTAFVEDIY